MYLFWNVYRSKLFQFELIVKVAQFGENIWWKNTNFHISMLLVTLVDSFKDQHRPDLADSGLLKASLDKNELYSKVRS